MVVIRLVHSLKAELFTTRLAASSCLAHGYNRTLVATHLAVWNRLALKKRLPDYSDSPFYN